MTIEEAREYWSRRLERAGGYSDEHWDAEERHAHADYIDALKYSVMALAIYREREEVAKPKTNGDRIRQMTNEELAALIANENDFCSLCAYNSDDPICCKPLTECTHGFYEWLKQEVNEDADD